MSQAGFNIIRHLKQKGENELLQGFAHPLLKQVAEGENVKEPVEKAAAGLADGSTSAVEVAEAIQTFGIEIPAAKGEDVSIPALMKLARVGAKQHIFVDPATQRFWFSNFGATAQDVTLAQFFEKFVSHFEEAGGYSDQIAETRDGLLMDRSVRRPLTQALVGNCERLSKAHLQDFLDASTEYCLPDAVFALVKDLNSKVPEMCPVMDKIITNLPNLENATRDRQVLRDSGTVFLECSKLSTARCEQAFGKLGISAKDSTALALGVYMKAREAKSDEIVIPSKVEKAILDMGNKCISIDLSNCSLNHPELKEPKNLGDSLTGAWDGVLNLDLSGNNLHAAGVAKVVEVMKHQKKLSHLSLRGNNIQASGIEKIINACVDHPSLTSLDISICHGGAQAAVAIGEAIPKTKITHLSCSGNDFGPSGCACVAAILKTDHRMVSLNMGGNHIGDAGALALADALSKDEYLNNLSVEENDISNDGATTLLQAMKAHKSLKKADLSYNWVNSDVVDEVSRIAQGSKTGLNVTLKGFGGHFQTKIKEVNASNAKKITEQLRALSHKPLAMWTADEVLVWSHLALNRLDLGQQLKAHNIDGAKLRSYTLKDFEKDGFNGEELKRLIFSFHETITTIH